MKNKRPRQNIIPKEISLSFSILSINLSGLGRTRHISFNDFWITPKKVVEAIINIKAVAKTLPGFVEVCLKLKIISLINLATLGPISSLSSIYNLLFTTSSPRNNPMMNVLIINIGGMAKSVRNESVAANFIGSSTKNFFDDFCKMIKIFCNKIKGLLVFKNNSKIIDYRNDKQIFFFNIEKK